jgi:nicotinamidase-related amidase
MRIPKDTALMIIDVQKAIDDPCWGPRNNPDAERKIARLLAVWRGAAMPVIHIRHDSAEPDSPYRPGQAGNDFKPEAAPAPGERVVAKQVNSAFIGTQLERQLNNAGTTTLVICGALTHNSVEATVRHAGNLGFRVFVVADSCWAAETRDLAGRVWPAADVHVLSLTHMQGDYAKVTDARTAIAAAERWAPAPA